MLKLNRLLRPLSSHFSKQFFCTSQQNQQPAVFEAKHSFGQAGTLTTNIRHINMDIHLKTIWEDYAALKLYSPVSNLGNYLNFTENERDCLLEDSELPKDITSTENNLLIAEIPEYYSLNLTNLGSVGFVKAEVSSKLCGNVNLQLLNENSKFFASKIKSEYFSAQINKGEFAISTFLESADFSLRSEALTTNIKRLGISQIANIDVGTGNFDIGSIYIGTFVPRGQKPVERPKLINISNEMEDINELIQKVSQDIENGNHMRVTAKKLKMEVGHWQGPSIITVEEANLNLKTYEGEKFILKANRGNVTLNLSKLGVEGIVYMESGDLNLLIEENLKVNVFSYKNKEAVGNEFNSGDPNLLLYLGDDVNLNVQRVPRRTIFDRFSKKQ